MCYDLTQTQTQTQTSKIIFNFTTQIKEDFTGAATNVVLTNTTDDVNTPAVADDTSVEIKVKGPPKAIIVVSGPVVEEVNV